MNQVDRYTLYIYRICIGILAVSVIYLWINDVRYWRYKYVITGLVIFLAAGTLIPKLKGNNPVLEIVIQFGCISILIYLLLLFSKVSLSMKDMHG